jgi:nicotinamidase/pyrazinamidase
LKALILVDLQNDFCPGGSLPVEEGDQIIPLINRLQEKFSLVVATKDWHPPDHESFATNHNRTPGEIILLHGSEQILWPVHCVQGTEGSDFVDGFLKNRIQRIFYKGTDKTVDGYSGFFDNEHLKSTGLGEFLKEKDVTEVYIAGLATDYCVRFSARDAIMLGLKTFVVEDACRGVELNPGDVKQAIKEMKTSGVHVITSRHIL